MVNTTKGNVRHAKFMMLSGLLNKRSDWHSISLRARNCSIDLTFGQYSVLPRDTDIVSNVIILPEATARFCLLVKPFIFFLMPLIELHNEFFMISGIARACPGLTGKAVTVSELVSVPRRTFAAAANLSSALIPQGAGAELYQPVWVHFHLYPWTSWTGSVPVCWVGNLWKAVGTDDTERWKTKYLLLHRSCSSLTQHSLASVFVGINI